MRKPIKVSVSVLCADFSKLGDEVRRCEDAGVDMFHVDVMDGHFVPNISVGAIIVETMRTVTKLPIEAHLMIEHPGMYIDQFVKAGADIISIHAECYGRLRKECSGLGQFPKEIDTLRTEEAKKDILRIRKQGKKAVMVLNPGTPMCLRDVLDLIDGVLIMSVNPGFARQKFMAVVLSKLQELRAIFDGDIAVDGGINKVTAKQAVEAGANILATASYFFGSDNPAGEIGYLKGL